MNQGVKKVSIFLFQLFIKSLIFDVSVRLKLKILLLHFDLSYYLVTGFSLFLNQNYARI